LVLAVARGANNVNKVVVAGVSDVRGDKADNFVFGGISKQDKDATKDRMAFDVLEAYLAVAASIDDAFNVGEEPTFGVFDIQVVFFIFGRQDFEIRCKKVGKVRQLTGFGIKYNGVKLT